jgi:hypothetical protein
LGNGGAMGIFVFDSSYEYLRLSNAVVRFDIAQTVTKISKKCKNLISLLIDVFLDETPGTNAFPMQKYPE